MRKTLLTAFALLALGAAPARAGEMTVVSTPATLLSFGLVAVAAPAWTGARTGLTVTEWLHASRSPWGWWLHCGAEATGAAGGPFVDCYLQGLETGTIYRPRGANTPAGGIADVDEPVEGCVRTSVMLREGSQFYETPLACARPA